MLFTSAQIILGLLITIVLILFFLLLIKKFRQPPAFGTTTHMAQILRQGRSGSQIYSHAKEYGIEETLDEIKKNTNAVKLQRDEILELMQEIKVTIAKEDVKQPENVINQIQEIKLKFVEIENKTQAIVAEQLVKKYAQEINKIVPEARIEYAKKTGEYSRAAVPEINRTTELDKKAFEFILTTLVAMPKETKSFVEYLEKKLVSLEKKFESLLMHAKLEMKQEKHEKLEPHEKHEKIASHARSLDKHHEKEKEEKSDTQPRIRRP